MLILLGYQLLASLLENKKDKKDAKKQKAVCLHY